MYQLGFLLCFSDLIMFHYPQEAPQREKIIKYFHSKSKRVEAICIKSRAVAWGGTGGPVPAP